MTDLTSDMPDTGTPSLPGLQSDYAVEVVDLVTHWGERKILNKVNITVNHGEIMVIMGGSGSGKSTCLTHMLKLHHPTSGSIKLLGNDITTLPAMEMYELRKKMGVAFQYGALFSSMSVGDNIMLPLREHTSLDRGTMEIMMRLKLEVVDLAGYEDFMPSELSGGMMKRAAMARAVIMDPKLLFLDEPSAGLDPVVAASLDDLILRLRDAMGMSIVVVTHELDKGEVLISATTEEVRNSPNERVQNLLNRRTEEVILDPDEYLRRLVGERID